MVRLMSLYLGIDQSYGGFGLSKIYTRPDGDRHQTIVQKFPLAKYKSSGHRLHYVRTWLVTQISAAWIDYTVMEGYARDARNRREESGEIAGVVKEALYEILADTPMMIVPPKQLKKFATGNGNASKEDMKASALERWGEEFTDDNAADAFHAAKLAEALHAGFPSPLAHEREVVADILNPKPKRRKKAA